MALWASWTFDSSDLIFCHSNKLHVGFKHRQIVLRTIVLLYQECVFICSWDRIMCLYVCVCVCLSVCLSVHLQLLLYDQWSKIQTARLRKEKHCIILFHNEKKTIPKIYLIITWHWLWQVNHTWESSYNNVKYEIKANV